MKNIDKGTDKIKGIIRTTKLRYSARANDIRSAGIEGEAVRMEPAG
jgi:hypothetical protein